MGKPITGKAARLEQVEITSETALWAWFESNHTQTQSIWLVTHKKHKRETYVSRDQVLDVVIAYGWIDGRRAVVDGDRTSQLLSVRKQQAWAKTYRDRAAKLIEQGRMQPAGQAAIDAAKAAGLWEANLDVDGLEVPDDVTAGLKLRPGAFDWFTQAAPSYRRNILRYIAQAKKPETRKARIDKLVEHCERGVKVPQY